MNPPGTKNYSVNVNTWDIYDAFAGSNTGEKKDEDLALLSLSKETAVVVDKEETEEFDEGPAVAVTSIKGLVNNENFRKAMRILEEAVLQNENHEHHMLFREHPQAVMEGNTHSHIYISCIMIELVLTPII